MRILWVYCRVTFFYALYEPTPKKREYCCGKNLRELVKAVKKTIGPISKGDDPIAVRFCPPGDAMISVRGIDCLCFQKLDEKEIKEFSKLFNKAT